MAVLPASSPSALAAPAEPRPKTSHADALALFDAVASGSLDAVREQQARGTPLDAADDGGRTGLMVAAEAGRVELLDTLLAEGCALRDASALGWTALTYAAFAGNVDALRHLAARGLAVDEPDVSGATPLSWAAAKGHAPAVRALLDLGADASACDVHGRTALAHAAGGAGDPLTIGALAGATSCDVNARDLFGRTPLIAAVLANRPHAVDALAKAGADTRLADAYVPGVVGPPTGPSLASTSAGAELTDEELAAAELASRVGKTALDYARERNVKHIERYLLALADAEADASGASVVAFPPVEDQVLVRGRMRAKLARQAEGGGGEASAVGAAGAGHALTGGSEDDALIFGDEDAAGDADSARDGTGDAGARSVDDIEGSLEDLD